MKGKSNDNLKRKIVFLLCLGSLAGTYYEKGYAKSYESGNVDEQNEINERIYITKCGVNFNNQVEIIDPERDEAVKVYGDGGNSGVEGGARGVFKNNLSITNKKENGYALYSTARASYEAATALISVNEGQNNIVKIIGNIKAYAYDESKTNRIADARINLNLNNKESFFAGKMETGKQQGTGQSNAFAKINLNLENEARWYAQQDEYTVDGYNPELKTYITSNGGIIDIYHKTPDEVRDGVSMGDRTFTLNKVGQNIKDTTFRISSDIEKKKADIIKLNDVQGVNEDTGEELAYYVQVVADPSFADGKWELEKDDRILVMEITGDNLDKIQVTGKEYTRPSDETAGLLEVTTTPIIEEDEFDGSGKWVMVGADKTIDKGDGHDFIEIAAAAAMAEAWRADNSDLFQRMGDLRNNEAEHGVWGRIYSGETEFRKGINTDLEYRAVQVGMDQKTKTEEGKVFTGIAFNYIDGELDSNHGSGESDSAAFGMYAAYMGNNGNFADFIFKYGHIDNELSYHKDGNTYEADYDTSGVNIDIEFGHHHDFENHEDYYIEPLAQLSYIHIEDAEYTMDFNGARGADVFNDSYESLIGRAGFQLGKNLGSRDNVYLRLMAAHEFSGDVNVSAQYNDTRVKTELSGGDTWIEYGVGFNRLVREDTALYGRLQRSTGDVVRNKWHASLGLRYTF